MDFIRGKCRFTLAAKNDYTIDELNRGGYEYVENAVIGGDNDYIVIDNARKLWTYGEWGTKPFYDIITLNARYSHLPLNELVKWKYAFDK